MNQNSSESIPTRHSLLSRLKDWGDQKSWQDFFDTYWPLIYNVAAKAGLTNVEAEEVVQETIIGVARHIGEFKTDARHGSFKAWLLQMTRWRVADQFRKREKAAPPFAPTHPRPAPALPWDESSGTATVDRIPDPAGLNLEQVWDEEWQRNQMRAALGRVKRQVSAKQYQMFDLHVLQHLSVADAARTLQVSAASIYMAKHRVSRLLRKEVQRLKSQA